MQLVHKPRNHSVCHSKYYQYWLGEQRAALCFFPRLQTFMGYLDSIHSGALQAALRCGLRLGVCKNYLVSDLGGQDRLDKSGTCLTMNVVCDYRQSTLQA